MYKVTILLNNKVIMNTIETSCGSTFGKNLIEYDFLMDRNFEDEVALHDDCWRIAKKMKLSYTNFENKSFKNNIYGFSVKGLDYKPIEKYWTQMFNTNKLLEDKNDYLLESPLKSKKNANRVIKNIKKLLNNIKKNKKSVRPSPEESATKFRIGTKKKGGDGNIWKVYKTKTGVRRWKKI